MSALALPQCDLDWLKRRVSNFAEDRPGVYRMVGPTGRVMYVGKAKRVRTRLLSYFRAAYPTTRGPVFFTRLLTFNGSTLPRSLPPSWKSYGRFTGIDPRSTSA